MDETEKQARALVTDLRKEADDLRDKINLLMDRQIAVQDSIVALSSLYPDLHEDLFTLHDEPPRFPLPKPWEPITAPAESDSHTRFEPVTDPAGRTLRDLIVLVLQESPKRWVTVKAIADHPLIDALDLADAEAAVRASIRRMNGRLKSRKIDGRTKGFRLAPTAPGSAAGGGS